MVGHSPPLVQDPVNCRRADTRPANDGLAFEVDGPLLDYERAVLVPGPALRFDRHGIVEQRYAGRWPHQPFTVATVRLGGRTFRFR